MNEPSNFIHGREEGCRDDPINKPLYVPGTATILQGTIIIGRVIKCYNTN